MVMASAGHTASQSLHAMQRSSPFGYRRCACSPRKRGLCGVFSSGNWTVTLRENMCRPVSIMPLSSSVSSRLLTRSLAAASMESIAQWLNGSMEQVGPARLHHRADEDDPHEGHRYEYLPAQAHHLV